VCRGFDCSPDPSHLLGGLQESEHEVDRGVLREKLRRGGRKSLKGRCGEKDYKSDLGPLRMPSRNRVERRAMR